MMYYMTLFILTVLFLLSGPESLSAESQVMINLESLQAKIIQAESSGRAGAVGDRGQSRGLMQIQKATWERHTDLSWDLAFDPRMSKMVGMRVLRGIRDHYGKRATPALISLSYNTGKWYKTIPTWALRHPNMIYRSLMRGDL